jgi:light-regulated signal transduction histidine kinase (bacteriophytochrome)
VFGMPAGQPDLSLSSIMAMVHADDRGNVEAMLGELKAGRDYAEFYERIVTPDGTGKTLLIRSKAIKDSSGRTVQVLGTAQDITGEKKTEQELTSKTRELQAANDELEKFAYIASHDLQEPLRKITMFGEILTEEYGDILDEKGKTHLHKITDASVRMKALILDILNFSRIAYSDVMYEECDLNQVIGQVLSDMEVAIGTNQAVVAYGQIPAIQAHSVQMGQLFQNLISNSIKFKKPGLPPVIDITAAIIRGGELPRPEAIKANYKLGGWNDDRYWQGEPFVRITVSDNGIGFDPEYAEKIFLLFQRLNTDQVAPGTGIGLTICKKIVDIHHGAISAEPGERQGATFTIILPVSQANF